MRGPIRFLLFALLVGNAACRSKPPAPSSTATEAGGESSAGAVVPIIEELAYFAELQAKRPDLLTGPGCYDALVLKPRYRQRLLGGSETFDSIRRDTYSPTEVAADHAWVNSLQEAELAYCRDTGNPGGCGDLCRLPCDACPDAGNVASTSNASVPVWPAGYPLCNFVGYFIGRKRRDRYDTTGKIVSYKVFFEFKEDFTKTLTPSAYLEFSRALAEAGYEGDSKISVGDGRVRYQYNDIIVHGHSPANAKLAERIGLAHFGAALAGHARGLDLISAHTGSELDWHHYLCAEGISGLSDEALAFVRHQD